MEKKKFLASKHKQRNMTHGSMHIYYIQLIGTRRVTCLDWTIAIWKRRHDFPYQLTPLIRATLCAAIYGNFLSLSRLIYLLYWLLEKILLFLFCSRRYYYFYCLLYYNNISVVYRVGRLFFCEIPPCYLPKREILIFFNINIIEFQLWASLYNDCFFINKQKY